ncbi:hypothetical protein OS493_020790 [Desmophyllum pertusum]|uniref:Uncharacterized protein n=1 Tax=Desmophyllum pertusum TaxID=174260 RepID=A0A9X0CKA5_9CNID|nr:hypothetical protein OS493_020790 [Desmophyllum pertusum]
MSCPLPRLVPYNKLIKFLNEADIGALYSVRESLCSDLEPEEQVDGCYRNLTECLIRIASFYLSTLKAEDREWFGEPNTFQVAIDGDGAPFGKYDQSCAWLISFLNVGHRILSNEDNFLAFGSNCSEQSTAAKSISTDDMCDVSRTFGPEPHNDFKPWSYNQRLAVAKKVVEFKDKVNKKQIAVQTKCSKVTTFITSNKSRQEFEPLIGKLIERAHVDPLHLKNNACKLIHKVMLHEAIQKSSLGSNVANFSGVPRGSPFSKFVHALKSKFQLSCLANKVIRWFNETKADGKYFEYRFMGRDSRNRFPEILA